MFIGELFENDKIPNAYYDEREDNTSRKLTDLRTTRLTLAQIKRLRMMNDVKKFEKTNKIEKLQTQYKAPAQAPAAV
jgi:hypothetical protein